LLTTSILFTDWLVIVENDTRLITNINAKVQEDTKTVSINVVVDIRDISQLDFVMTKLRRIREVYTVQRSKGGA